MRLTYILIIADINPVKYVVIQTFSNISLVRYPCMPHHTYWMVDGCFYDYVYHTKRFVCGKTDMNNSGLLWNTVSTDIWHLWSCETQFIAGFTGCNLVTV